MKNKSFMNKKKGFTLVELLAIIVILSIILAIAMIGVNRTINKSKLEANLISAQTLVKAIKEDLVLNDNIKSEGFAYYSTNNEMFKNLIDGQYPTGGAIVMYNNTLIQANLCYKDQSISYDFDGEVYKKYNDNDFCKYDTYPQANGIEYVTSDTLDSKTKLYGKKYQPDNFKKMAQSVYEKPNNNKYPSKEEKEAAIKDIQNGDYGKYKELIKKYYSKNSSYIPEIKLEHSSKKLDELMDTSAKVSNKISQMANDSVIQDSFVLGLSPGSDAVKNAVHLIQNFGENSFQLTDGTCWANSVTSQISSNYAIFDDKVVEFSEEHINFFTASNAISSLTNPFSNIGEVERPVIDGGGNFRHILKTLFSGLTLQTKQKFGDDNIYESTLDDNYMIASKESSKEVYDVNNLEYYIKQGNLLTLYTDRYYNEEEDYFDIPDYILERYKLLLKSIIKNYGGANAFVDFSNYIDSKAFNFDNIVKENNKGLEICNQKNSNSNCIISSYISPFDSITNPFNLHIVNLIGWDDSFTYEGQTGYWIARDPQLWVSPVLLIPYDSPYLYINNYFNNKVSKKDFDNSYNSYNISSKMNPLYSNLKYMKKVSNKKEKITGFSYLEDNQNTNTKEFYIIDTANIDECLNYKYNLNGYKYQVRDDDLYVYDSKWKKIGAKAVYYPYSLTNEGYDVTSNVGDYIFVNNYCVIGSEPVTIFTKNAGNASKNNKNVSAELVSKKETSKEHVIDVAVNNNISDSYEVQIKVKDNSGNDVTNKCEIKDKKLINNIAHVYVKLPDTKKYKVYARYNDVTSNEVVLNESSTQTSTQSSSQSSTQSSSKSSTQPSSKSSTQSSSQNSNNEIRCTIGKKPETIYADSTETFSIGCESTDADTEIATKSIPLDKIDLGLFSNIYIKVESVGDCPKASTVISCPFRLKTNKFLLFNHNIKIKLKENAVFDVNGVGNGPVSRALSVKRKRK